MKNLSCRGVLIVAGLVAAGCSSGYSSSTPDYSADLAEMKERILELQEQATVADVEIKRLRQQVALLEGRLAGNAPSSSPDVRVMVDPPPGDSPAIESSTPDPVIMVEVEESDLDPPVQAGAAAATGAAASQATSTPEIAPSVASESSQSVSDAPEIVSSAAPSSYEPVDSAGQALYDRGYTLYHQGRYLDAEASFQRFLQANPATELSDNAQFWIGESRYARGDIRGALAAFRETLQRYPDGNKVPDALIKEGDCLTSLGDRDGARSRYEEVIRRFPSSAAAIMAEERLAALD
jgi:tol-pal system protein YbgF